MIAGKSILAVIPARGGSKGVPGKNIRPLAGKPLIAWTIEAARQVPHLDRIIVSSEDEAILEISRAFGAETPFIRPMKLARDDTPGIAPVLHALEALPEKYDYVVLLQPTSPLRTAEDIDAALELCLKRAAPACVSVTEPKHKPWWMFSLSKQAALEALFRDMPARRQDMPAVYALNGAVYAARTHWLVREQAFVHPETLAYIMPPERSLDIDTEFDFKVAEVLLNCKA